MSTLLKLVQMEDSRTSEGKQIAMHGLETSSVNVSRHIICVAELYPWHASAQDEMMMPENFSDICHVLPYELDTIYMTHMNPLPFHSPALRYITLQVAKSSAILEGDIDPNDLWGKWESLTWLEEAMKFIWILWWLILKSKVFWGSLEFKGVLKTDDIWFNHMEPGEVAKLWEVCRRIKNASLNWSLLLQL